MSVVAVSRKMPVSPIRIGVLRLTDSAPVIAAYELGFFADEGLEIALSIEPSWANVADKLAYGALDAAPIVPPLAIAISLGLRGAAQKLILPYVLSLGGNTVTIAKPIADEVKAAGGRGAGLGGALAERLRRFDRKPTLAVVHDYSTHNLLLRYWLATSGLLAERDFEIVVTPPARTLEALQTGKILGFCAGAPWGEIAVRAGAGATVATTNQIWRDAPEKALGVREAWASANPDALHGLLRALYRSARFCDAPQNAAYVAALLGRRVYLDVDPHAILSSLPGTLGGEAPSVFHRHAATFPWRSHGHWMHAQMARWGLIGGDASLREAVVAIYRPDIYAAALEPVGAAIPTSAVKPEGGHAGSWFVPASPAPIAMESDLFCDGAVF
jgi:ABC-type nitrate/sulfonate/bicarbonate transport system substrate-binding protein